jgi:hypothetical protein
MMLIEAIDTVKEENFAGQLATVTERERYAPIAKFMKSLAQRAEEVNGGASSSTSHKCNHLCVWQR